MTVLHVGDGGNISNLNLFLGFSGFGVDCPDPIVLVWSFFSKKLHAHRPERNCKEKIFESKKMKKTEDAKSMISCGKIHFRDDTEMFS